MARAPGGRAGTDRTDIYQDITDKIIAELSAGCFPWVQPWESAGAALGMPRNFLTGRPYSGVNILLLWRGVREGGFRSHNWLTFRQALDAGGQVRRGQRGTTLVYAKRFECRDEDDHTPDADDAARTFMYLKRFTVFNVAQCEGLEVDAGVQPVVADGGAVEEAETLIAASGVDFVVGGYEAFYSPTDDLVRVPPRRAFYDEINSYRTYLHELVHATGHASRLDRDLSAPFGTPAYAREELIAEIGSAFLCATLGIVPTVRHADYIGPWLEILRDDNRAIVRAASAASRAAEYLLARYHADKADFEQIAVEDEAAEEREPA
jgi:antirestriction protein ArdC